MNMYKFLFFLVAGGLFASQLYSMEMPNYRTRSSSSSSEETPPPVPVRTTSLPPSPTPPIRTTSLAPAPVPPARTTSLPPASVPYHHPMGMVPMQAQPNFPAELMYYQQPYGYQPQPYPYQQPQPMPAYYQQPQQPPMPTYYQQQPQYPPVETQTNPPRTSYYLQEESANQPTEASANKPPLTKEEGHSIEKIKEDIKKITEDLLEIAKHGSMIGLAAATTKAEKVVGATVKEGPAIVSNTVKISLLIANIIKHSRSLSHSSPEVRAYAKKEIVKSMRSDEFKRATAEVEEFAKSDNAPKGLRGRLQSLVETIKNLPAEIVEKIIK